MFLQNSMVCSTCLLHITDSVEVCIETISSIKHRQIGKINALTDGQEAHKHHGDAKSVKDVVRGTSAVFSLFWRCHNCDPRVHTMQPEAADVF